MFPDVTQTVSKVVLCKGFSLTVLRQEICSGHFAWDTDYRHPVRWLLIDMMLPSFLAVLSSASVRNEVVVTI